MKKKTVVCEAHFIHAYRNVISAVSAKRKELIGEAKGWLDLARIERCITPELQKTWEDAYLEEIKEAIEVEAAPLAIGKAKEFGDVLARKIVEITR